MTTSAVTNVPDANVPAAEEERRQRQIEENRSLSELLRSWLEEDDDEGEQEQRETWEVLKQALDEDRHSYRSLFT